MRLPAHEGARFRAEIALRNEQFNLIVQTGDEAECLLTAPWAAALGEQKGIVVDVATRKQMREIFERIPAVRWTLVDKDGLPGLWRLGEVVRRTHYDTAIDLSAGLAGRVLARATRARQTLRVARNRGKGADERIASLFNKIGIEPAPIVWRPTRRTIDVADRLLAELGFPAEKQPAFVAPALSMGPFDVAAWHARINALNDTVNGIPLILLPPRGGLQQFALLAGNGLFVRAPDLALRAALIRRACRVVSDEPWACRISRECGIPLIDLRPVRTD